MTLPVRYFSGARLQSVVGYFTKDNMPWITLACGHVKPLPAGVYDANTKRLCRECSGEIFPKKVSKP